MRRFILAGALAALSLAGLGGAALYNEPFRMQYHFSPAHTWTNDPNGLVWYKDEYHLFFQNNPFGSKWGHMSWGHAVSKDLVHWKELPVAIPEENGIMIFSGSAVVDASNSSGLCKSADPKDQSCLIAIYTGHTATLQTQNIAYSNDRGRTFTKYAHNPVIDLHMKDFRDPKVIWHAPSKSWVMAVSLPNEHKIKFYSSKNLLQWTALSEFGPAGATGGQWECPDLFELAADAKGPERKWVLIVNINPGGHAGGSATQYFVGQFDGRQFHNENPPKTTLWADYGKDFYAAVSYFNSRPDDYRRIFQGWFSNWQYANDEPTSPQRGALEFPREVMLRHKPEGTRMIQAPVSELALLHGTEMSMRDREIDSVNQDIRKEGFRGHELEIEVTFEPGSAQEFGLLAHKGGSEQTIIGVKKSGQLFVDRTKSGKSDFSPQFAGVQSGPLRIGKQVLLRVLLDRSSVEVFGDDGQVTLSDRVFPAPSSDAIEFYARGGTARIASLRMWKINSAWPRAASTK